MCLRLVGGNGPTMKNRDPIKMGIIVRILSFHSIFVMSHTGVYHRILGHTATITTPSETLQLSVHNKIAHNGLKVNRSELVLFMSPPKGHEPNSRNKNKLPEGSIKCHEVLSIDKERDDDSMFSFLQWLDI